MPNAPSDSGAPSLTRRRFLKLGASAGLTAGALAGLQRMLGPGTATAYEGTLVGAAHETMVRSACLLCPNGCGLEARVADGRLVKLEGNRMHPVNLGTLCPKGQAGTELLYNPDRLTVPLERTGARGAGQWAPITWDAAIQRVAARLNELRANGQPERAALLYGETRGQQRPFFERFMAAVGSPNAISRESLNVAAAKLGNYFTQGIYDLPAYDLESSRFVLAFGASLLEAGRTPQRTIAGVSYLRRGRAERGKLVVVDPRQGVTGAKADEWVPIVPGTDAVLALSMAHVIVRAGLFDSEFVHNYAFGFEDFADDEGRLRQGFKRYVLENFDPKDVADIVGLPAATISRLAGEFAGSRPAVAVLPAKGGLLNGTLGGIYTAMAVQCLNALVGAIEAPGGVMTQRYPQLAEWPSLPADAVAERGRQAERVDGAGSLYPLAEAAYQAVADRVLGGYPLEVLFLSDANPIYEAPGGQRFASAFDQIPLVVALTSFLDESAEHADLVLPVPTFLERWEDDYFEGLGYAGLALRQPVVEPLYDTLSAGDFFLRVAAAMGGPVAAAFPWPSYQALLHDRLVASGADWDLLVKYAVWMNPGYHFARRGSRIWVEEVVGADRRLAPQDGRFDFYSRELELALAALDDTHLVALGLGGHRTKVGLPHYLPTPFSGDPAEFPFVLNVITLMSLGSFSPAANLPTLQEICGMTVGETWSSWVEMNPERADHLGLHDKQEVWVESPFGKVRTRLRLVKALRPDVVNLPYNQGHAAATWRFARDRGVNGLALLNPGTEPASGLAMFTNTRVRVYRA